MPNRKSNSTSLKRELAKLKKQKAKVAATRKELIDNNREREEIREIKREINKLKGVGTKREVAKKLGITGAKTGWKGLKFAGRFIRDKLEAEARSQDREAAMDRAKAKRRKKK